MHICQDTKKIGIRTKKRSTVLSFGSPIVVWFFVDFYSLEVGSLKTRVTAWLGHGPRTDDRSKLTLKIKKFLCSPFGSQCALLPLVVYYLGFQNRYIRNWPWVRPVHQQRVIFTSSTHSRTTPASRASLQTMPYWNNLVSVSFQAYRSKFSNTADSLALLRNLLANKWIETIPFWSLLQRDPDVIGSLQTK